MLCLYSGITGPPQSMGLLSTVAYYLAGVGIPLVGVVCGAILIGRNPTEAARSGALWSTSLLGVGLLTAMVTGGPRGSFLALNLMRSTLALMSLLIAPLPLFILLFGNRPLSPVITRRRVLCGVFSPILGVIGVSVVAFIFLPKVIKPPTNLYRLPPGYTTYPIPAGPSPNSSTATPIQPSQYPSSLTQVGQSRLWLKTETSLVRERANAIDPKIASDVRGQDCFSLTSQRRTISATCYRIRPNTQAFLSLCERLLRHRILNGRNLKLGERFTTKEASFGTIEGVRASYSLQTHGEWRHGLAFGFMNQVDGEPFAEIYVVYSTYSHLVDERDGIIDDFAPPGGRTKVFRQYPGAAHVESEDDTSDELFNSISLIVSPSGTHWSTSGEGFH